MPLGRTVTASPRQRTGGARRGLRQPPGTVPSGQWHASDPTCRGDFCYIIRVIVAVPDAGSPAPTGGGTHPLNHCQQREYQRRSAHCAARMQVRPCALSPPMRNADAPPRARLRAIDILLDRGWGRPA